MDCQKGGLAVFFADIVELKIYIFFNFLNRPLYILYFIHAVVSMYTCEP